MDKSRTYYKGLDERDATPEFLASLEREFPELPDRPENGESGKVDRRTFLVASGFGIAATTLYAYQKSVERLVAGTAHTENAVPGRAYQYATFCQGCTANCGMVAKVVDGRPIKLEGSSKAGVSGGGLCAIGQASLLSLYDSLAVRKPLKEGKESSWAEVDGAVKAALASTEGRVVFLGETTTSPTLNGAIESFLSGFESSGRVTYDPLSASAILDAHEETHGTRRLPHYQFDRARVIASVDADFLGTWISPVEYTATYRRGRDLEEKHYSRHIQFESRLSLTGANADIRYAVGPHQLRLAVAHLAVEVAHLAGTSLGWDPLPAWDGNPEAIHSTAKALWENRDHALVVCGVNDLATQTVVNRINELLGAYGNTIALKAPSRQKTGKDSDVESLLGQMESGEVGALLIHGVNPAYDRSDSARFAAALKNVPVVISFADRLDETGALANYLCPDRHFLERWSDGEPVAGHFVLGQPMLHPLGDDRPLLETLAAWSGKPVAARDCIRAHWKKDVFPKQKEFKTFGAFWNQAVHDGGFTIAVDAKKAGAYDPAKTMLPAIARPSDSAFALVAYPAVAMFDGRHGHNPWLQELPDPITKITWDNAACLAPIDAEQIGVKQGDVIRLDAGGSSLELPVYLQPGQAAGTVAVSLGYGRKGTDRFSKVGPQWWEGQLTVEAGQTIGGNVLSLGAPSDVKLTSTGDTKVLACTQMYHSLTVPEGMGDHRGPRPIVQETTLGAYHKDPHAGAPHHAHPTGTLWKDDFEYDGHHWGMVIDLNACTGCSACLISCQAENNVPVVGKDEIARGREMHWIRIDRYFAEQEDGVDTVFQPMMCQHCDNAPCEVVCPVLATVHSSEGLNQQVYNRCVGTRYCANNCPYKVRRFNWFDYPHADDLQNLALNPDITVRTRGVMEKCSMCVQRIQEAKSEAIRRGEDVGDGEIQTACQQSCPANAIIFGDLNDPDSRLARHVADPRHYHVLEEINVRPTVGYMRVVRNRDGEGDHHE